MNWEQHRKFPQTLYVLCWASSLQLCLILCNSMDSSVHSSSAPGSSVHGILQAWILEWVPFPSPGDLPNPGIEPRSGRFFTGRDSLQGRPVILERVACPFSRGTFWLRNQTGISCIAGGFFTSWATQVCILLNFLTFTHWLAFIFLKMFCKNFSFLPCNPLQTLVFLLSP